MIAIISVIISALVSHNVVFYGGLAPFCPNQTEGNSGGSAAKDDSPVLYTSAKNAKTKEDWCKHGRIVFGAVLGAVMFVSVVTCYFINKLLVRFSAEYLFTFLCIIVPACFALFADFLANKLHKRCESSADENITENNAGCVCDNADGDKSCGKKWGSIGTILITATSVTLVVALNITSLSAVQMIFAALFSAIGYLFALVILGSIAERMETASIPRFFKGVPALLLAAAIIALALFAFESFSFNLG